MPAGQPAYYKTPEEMQIKIDEYFDSIDIENKEKNLAEESITPYTITGLALHLGFTSRQALMNYEKNGKFFDTVKAAKLRIEEFNERMLYRNGQVTGVIFNLKNNFGYTDKIETDNNNTNFNYQEPSKEKIKEIHSVIDELI